MGPPGSSGPPAFYHLTLQQPTQYIKFPLGDRGRILFQHRLSVSTRRLVRIDAQITGGPFGFAAIYLDQLPALALYPIRNREEATLSRTLDLVPGDHFIALEVMGSADNAVFLDRVNYESFWNGDMPLTYMDVTVYP